ncbi:MAG: DUF3299 domain-containing protein [Pseudomonadota bacterium]
MRFYANRRDLLAHLMALAAVGSTGLPARASETPIELEWDDLVPGGTDGLLVETLRGLGVVEHGQYSSPFDQEAASAVVTDYDGKLVRIPGYAVPLDFSGTGISSFILVPYIGACIHVPPPPANQLVFVNPEEPFESESMWDPIFATGTLTTSAVSTELAEIGYAMSGATIEPYY